MQKLILYAVAFIFFGSATAQNSIATKLNQEKFEIVKKSVEFLATDTIFKHVKTRTCTDCKTYEDLKNFVKENGLINADKKVIELLAGVALDTAANKQDELSRYSKQAINTVAGEGKERRKNLPEFKRYEQELLDISNGTPERNQPASNNVVLVKHDYQDTTSKKAMEPTVKESSGILHWIPYALSLILLALLIFVWLENVKDKRKKSGLKERHGRLENELVNARQEISDQKKQIIKLQKEAEEREGDIQNYQVRLNYAESQYNELSQKQNASQDLPAEPEASLKPSAKAQKNIPAAITKYSRYADLGDGFSSTELLDNPDNKTIFELIISPDNTGTYKVVSNPSGQSYALSNAQYFLGKTCRYDSFPGSSTRIQTDQPGFIQLTSGKWTITNPAKISFS